MTEITVEASFGGQPMPITGFSCGSGAYGSVGHAEIMTGRKALAAAGINLFATSVASPSGIEVDLYVTVGTDGRQQIFGGEYVTGDWDFDTDSVTIHARDWAGVLVDQKRILTSIAGEAAQVLAPGQTDEPGATTRNQTLSQIVTAIAKQFSLTPVIILGEGDDPNPTIGTIYPDSGDNVYMSLPQSLWGLLNRLARDTGNEVYVTPNRSLVFGPPGQGNTLFVTYGVNSLPAGAIAARGLKIVHNPRRNSSFRVQVLSYDPFAGLVTTGDAYALGTNLTGSNQTTIQPGLWDGGEGSDITSSLSPENKQLPLYSFHVDGLTAAQAQDRAVAIAKDIGARELIVSFTADPIPSIRPQQPLQLSGAIDADFIGSQYYVNSYQHRFTLPTRSGGTGLVTEVTALDFPVGGIGKSVVKTAPNK